jgi:hypothetical protein
MDALMSLSPDGRLSSSALKFRLASIAGGLRGGGSARKKAAKH